jgi:hypothetical protein
MSMLIKATGLHKEWHVAVSYFAGIPCIDWNFHNINRILKIVHSVNAMLNVCELIYCMKCLFQDVCLFLDFQIGKCTRYASKIRDSNMPLLVQSGSLYKDWHNYVALCSFKHQYFYSIININSDLYLNTFKWFKLQLLTLWFVQNRASSLLSQRVGCQQLSKLTSVEILMFERT